MYAQKEVWKKFIFIFVIESIFKKSLAYLDSSRHHQQLVVEL
jgi:hypothetical protein